MPYKHSPTMEISSNDESDVSCEQIQCCSYCSKDKVLVKGKPTVTTVKVIASGNVNAANDHSTMKNTSLTRRLDVTLVTRNI